MLKNVLSITIKKPNLLSSTTVLLLIMGISTRSFGLPKEVFYALFFGIFTFIITNIKVREFTIPKTLFLTLALTYLLTFTGLIHFYFERESDFSQQLLIILAIFKVFCSVFVLYIVDKNSKSSSWLSLLNAVLRISIIVGLFQWIAFSLGFNNLANIIQLSSKIIGIFPIIRINSIYPENQHFATILIIYLYSNYQLSQDRFKIIKSNLYESNIIKEAIKEKTSIFFKLALFLLFVGGSTTSIIILIYFLLMTFLIKNEQLIKLNVSKILYFPNFSWLIKIKYKNLLIGMIITISILFLLLTSGERIKSFSEKQFLRIQLLSRVITLSDDVIDPKQIITSSSRAISLDKAVQTFKNPTIEIPPYSRESRNVYKDGFIKNISKFGIIGSILFMFSFIVPLFFNTSKIGIIMFFLLMFLYWGKGSTYPTPDIFIIYLYSYFVNYTFSKKEITKFSP